MRPFCACAVILLALAALLPLGAGEKGTPPILHKLMGHTDGVYTVAFSPDGRYLATGSFDNTLKLWESGDRQGSQDLCGAAGPSEDGPERRLQSRWPASRLRRRRQHAQSLGRAARRAPAFLQDAVPRPGRDAQPRRQAARRRRQGWHDQDRQRRRPQGVGPVRRTPGPGHRRRLQRQWSGAGQHRQRPHAPLLERRQRAAGGRGRRTPAPRMRCCCTPTTPRQTVGDDGLLKFWQVPPAPTSKVFAGHAAPSCPGAVRRRQPARHRQRRQDGAPVRDCRQGSPRPERSRRPRDRRGAQRGQHADRRRRPRTTRSISGMPRTASRWQAGSRTTGAPTSVHVPAPGQRSSSRRAPTDW